MTSKVKSSRVDIDYFVVRRMFGVLRYLLALYIHGLVPGGRHLDIVVALATSCTHSTNHSRHSAGAMESWEFSLLLFPYQEAKPLMIRSWQSSPLALDATPPAHGTFTTTLSCVPIWAVGNGPASPNLVQSALSYTFQSLEVVPFKLYRGKPGRLSPFHQETRASSPTFAAGLGWGLHANPIGLG